MILICSNPRNDEYCNECKHSKPHEMDGFACPSRCELQRGKHLHIANCVPVNKDEIIDFGTQERIEI